MADQFHQFGFSQAKQAQFKKLYGSGPFSKGNVAIGAIDPLFQITIEGVTIGPDIAQFIESIEYESADGIADMAKVTISNIDGIFTDSKMFQAGNEMNIAMGYAGGHGSYAPSTKGARTADRVIIRHVGRVELMRPKFTFPDEGIPTIEVTGYTADVRMMEGKSTKAKTQSERAKALRKSKKLYINQWAKGEKLLTVIKDVVSSSAYGFNIDADEAANDVLYDDLYQHPGTADYDIIKGLSNYYNYVFWVDGDEDGIWTLHFRKPNKQGILPDVQKRDPYTFQYGHTLFSFDPEYSFRDVKTKIVVELRNPDSGVAFTAEFEDDEASPDMKFDGDPTQALPKAIQSGGSAKIFLGEFQIETITDKHFKTDVELKQWADSWFKQHKVNFINGTAEMIGIEDVSAREVHFITGLGVSLDGEYYFGSVRHMMNDSGYKMEVHARKVIGSTAKPKIPR